MDSVRTDPGDRAQLGAERLNERRLGEVLLSQHMLSDAQVEETVRFQSETGLAFGAAALKLGFVTERALKHALARQRGYPHVEAEGVSLASTTLFAARRPFCRQSDALRELRTRLRERWLDAGHKSLAIVGAHGKAGRTYLTANLGVSFAQMGLPTLVVDADLRNPGQHQMFGLPNRAGLETALAMRDGLQLHRMREVPDLWVLPAGPVPIDAVQLLGSERFANLIESLEKRFEVILFDTPALSSHRDGEIVAQRARSALFVVRKDRTRAEAEATCVQQLAQRGVGVVGAVFNAAA